MKNQLPRFIPEGARKVETPADLPVAVYLYERGDHINALAFRGKATNPAFNYRFRSAEHREKYVTSWIADIAVIEKARTEEKEKRAAHRKDFRHAYKVGDILFSSWGYDQTNVEFYEIVSVTEKSVTFREVRQDRERSHHDGGSCSPRRGEYIGKEIKRVVLPGYGFGAGFKGKVSYNGRSLSELNRPSCSWSDGH